MRKTLIYTYLYCFWVGCPSLMGQATPNFIQPLRYDDHLVYLKADSNRTHFDKIKIIPFGDQHWFSWGGDLREQLYLIANPNFGDVPVSFKKASVTQHWHRMMLHAQLEIGQKYRFFVQINNTNRFFNPNPLTPEVDENQLSLHQCFLEGSLYDNWRLRLGRQEVIYGNSRLLGVRDLPNTRLSFDGAVLRWKKAAWTVDVLSLSPVIGKPQIGDDAAFQNWITGVYATQKIKPTLFHIDYYALHYRGNQLKYNQLAGTEKRSMFGFRAFSAQPVFNYELEATYQLGSFNYLKINAFSIIGEVHYRLWKVDPLVIGLGWSYQTGDKNAADGQLNTYNTLYARAPFGVAVPLSLANITHVNPYFRYKASPELTLQGGFAAIYRTQWADGVYTPSMVQGRASGQQLPIHSAYKWGNQYSFEIIYQPNIHAIFTLTSVFVPPGNYAQATGKGGMIAFLSPKVSFKF